MMIVQVEKIQRIQLTQYKGMLMPLPHSQPGLTHTYA